MSHCETKKIAPAPQHAGILAPKCIQIHSGKENNKLKENTKAAIDQTLLKSVTNCRGKQRVQEMANKK